MKSDEIRNFFKNSNKFSWIDVTGGEVFLRKDIIEIISTILHNCKNLYHLHIPTNSIVTHLTVSKIKEILKLRPKPNKFTITLSWMVHPNFMIIFEELKITGQQFWKHMMNCEGMKIETLKFFSAYTLSKLNLGKFNETVLAVQRRFPQVKYEDFHMNIAHTSDHYYNNSNFNIGVDTNKEEFISEVEAFRVKKNKLFNPINNLENKYLTHAKKFISTGITPIDCKSLSSSVFIDPYGNVFPCSIWDKKIGNIRDFNYDLIALLASAGFARLCEPGRGRGRADPPRA